MGLKIRFFGCLDDMGYDYAVMQRIIDASQTMHSVDMMFRIWARCQLVYGLCWHFPPLEIGSWLSPSERPRRPKSQN